MSWALVTVLEALQRLGCYVCKQSKDIATKKIQWFPHSSCNKLVKVCSGWRMPQPLPRNVGLSMTCWYKDKQKWNAVHLLHPHDIISSWNWEYVPKTKCVLSKYLCFNLVIKEALLESAECLVSSIIVDIKGHEHTFKQSCLLWLYHILHQHPWEWTLNWKLHHHKSPNYCQIQTSPTGLQSNIFSKSFRILTISNRSPCNRSCGWQFRNPWIVFHWRHEQGQHGMVIIIILENWLVPWLNEMGNWLSWSTTQDKQSDDSRLDKQWTGIQRTQPFNKTDNNFCYDHLVETITCYNINDSSCS